MTKIRYRGRRRGCRSRGYGAIFGHKPSIDALKRERLWPYPYLDALVMGGILVARTEAQLLLIKRAGTPNTGNAATPAERKFAP